MLNPNRVFMLAADHRWQWEEWCDAQAMPRERIRDAKRVAYEGFRLAHRESAAARAFGAFLIDEQYAAPIIAEAVAAGLEVGTPAERPGAFPLAWTAEPFSRALTGRFVKVLVRHRPDQVAAIREQQLAMLGELQTWCRDNEQPLIVEVLVQRESEPEDEFEALGRPAIVASYIRDAYAHGLMPAFWKIEGTADPRGARIIDAAICARDGGRQIILGKGAGLTVIEGWFAAARESRSAAGFAIGRSVVWEPLTKYLTGVQSADEAARHVCANYLQLIDCYGRG